MGQSSKEQTNSTLSFSAQSSKILEIPEINEKEILLAKQKVMQFIFGADFILTGDLSKDIAEYTKNHPSVLKTKIAIISDSDEDGFSSAIQAKRFFDLYKIPNDVFIAEKEVALAKKPFWLSRFKKFSPDKIISLDLGEDRLSNILNGLNSIKNPKFYGQIAMVDHHKSPNVLDNRISLIIKPFNFSNLDGAKYCNAKMCFDIFEGTPWIASVGIIGDFCVDKWSVFVEESCIESKISIIELEDFGNAVISAARSDLTGKICSKVFETIYVLQKPSEIKKTRLWKIKLRFDKKLDLAVKKFKKNAEYFEDSNAYFFKSVPGITSKLSNILSSLYKNSTIFIYLDMGKTYGVSVRRQDYAVDCSEMMRKCVVGIKGAMGGGHKPAAGATVPKKYFKQFKENCLNYLRTIEKK
jgi:oligoribonuclease NrnB/cAMP/cGMP phosphodiesterase (DHH superfamily)